MLGYIKSVELKTRKYVCFQENKILKDKEDVGQLKFAEVQSFIFEKNF